MRIVLTLRINPEPWTSPSVSIGRSGNKKYPIVYASEQLKAYKNAVAEEAQVQLGQEYKPWDGPFQLLMYFSRRLDDYLTDQAKRARKHEADATNMQKATEDALQKVLFTNDRNAVNVSSWIMEQSHDADPWVIVEMRTKFQMPKVKPEPAWTLDGEFKPRTETDFEIDEYF